MPLLLLTEARLSRRVDLLHATAIRMSRKRELNCAGWVLANMEGRPPLAAPKSYAKAGVVLGGTEPVPPVIQFAKVDRPRMLSGTMPAHRRSGKLSGVRLRRLVSIARGAHDPPAGSRLRPRIVFSTGSYRVARCDLLRPNRGAAEIKVLRRARCRIWSKPWHSPGSLRQHPEKGERLPRRITEEIAE